MTTQTMARRLAAIAFPLFLLHAVPAAARRGAAPAPAVRQLPHISVEVTGAGSPIILIPGLSSPRAVWDGVTPDLARTHRVYRVQVNGFGGDQPGANLAPGILDGLVGELHQIIVREKLGAVPIVGHSMGGLAALMLAKAHPEDVSRLMIVDSLPFIGDLFAPGATVPMLAPQAGAMRDRMAAQYGKPADPAGNAALAESMALTPAARAQVARWVAKADARVSAEALYEDMSTDLRPDMGAIVAPITLIYPWSTPAQQGRAGTLYRQAYAAAPHVTFVDIGNSGHFAMLDQPAAFTAALTTFAR